MATPTKELPTPQLDGIGRSTRHIAQALRARSDVAVLLVRLSGMERMYASAGHLETAERVAEFHEKLDRICRDNDVVERIGDRKFVVILGGLKNRGHVTLAARKIERVARSVVLREGTAIPLKIAIGVAIGPEQADHPHDLLRLAEVACLDARRQSDSLKIFEPQSANRLFQEWDLESRLKDALEAGDLELYFQPKAQLTSGEIVAAEALARWHDPDIGPISPEIFVDLAESSGHIAELTQFAVQTSCRMLNEWRDVLPRLQLAINVTPSMIVNHDIVEVLRSATSIWGVAPERLTLEITETALMDAREASHGVLIAIREIGCRVSIDDFGTGYSSLAYLKEIPADELKIDRTFVMGMLEDPGDCKIVEHAINIAKSFDLSVVAEGIETAETLAALRRLDCDYAQGYYISKPLPADEFVMFCRDHRIPA